MSYSYSARPCSKDAAFLDHPEQAPAPEAPLTNFWQPFPDRLAFDFAEYHYVKLQSSKARINEGLDLWLAATLKCGSSDGTPWRNADEMYKTIDQIQQGGVGWSTVEFSYTGPKPSTPPKWMQATYQLNCRDALALVLSQLEDKEFNRQFDYTPYAEYDAAGDRVLANLMSGEWANSEAVRTLIVYLISVNDASQDMISKDPLMHGSMLVPIIAGSDKTTESVATGHQEYHPVYISPGNLSNTAHQGHGNGVLPVAFLPIPKSEQFIIYGRYTTFVD